MPHIEHERRIPVQLQTIRPEKLGDLCYLFSVGIVEEYSQAPSWTTIHNIRVAMRNPYHTTWSHEIIQTYMLNFSKVDIEVAADLAFLEFYRLVAAKYEDQKVIENGSVFEGLEIPSKAVGFVPKRGPGRPKKEEANG